MRLPDWFERAVERRRTNRLGVWAEPFALYRNPRGGVEDVGAAKRAGLRTALLNVGDFSPEAWKTVIDRLDVQGIRWGWWRHCRTLTQLEELRWLSVNKPVVGVNVEAELETTLSPGVVQDVWRFYKGSPLLITLGWIQNNVDLSPLEMVVAPEIFPQEVLSLEPPKVTTTQCLDHARALGAKGAVPLYGAYRGYSPANYDRTIPHGLFCVDDVEPRWDQWRFP